MKRIYLILTAILISMVMPGILRADTWGNYRIMIDPGHGGSDPGASGPSAPHEATLCLRASKALANKFVALGAPYKLTRTTDETLSLSARRSMSISYDPYIFCSIHLNAYNGSAHGTETWYYWSTGNSQPLANKVQASLVKEMGRYNRGVKQNGWTVITGSASIPAVLTEGLFVDNSTEWSLIKDEGSTGFNNWVNGHLFAFYDHLVQFNSNITNPRNGVGSGGGSTESTPEPALSLNASSWNFTCEAGKYVIATFSAYKSNTTEPVTVTSNNSAFIVNLVTQHSGGAWFDIKFAPQSAGSYSGTLTVKCGSLTKTIAVSGTATSPPPAYLQLDYSNWSFNCRAGSTDVATFSAARINTTATGDVTVTSDNPLFACTAITPHDDGAWFNVTFSPTASGTYTGTLTVTSCGLSTQLKVTGTATAENIYFKEKWNFSDYNKTSTYCGWDATQVRNMTYGNGKLYLVYEQKDIKVVNAQNGAEIGNLNKVNMFGGTVDVADVKFCDGKLVASNIAIAANGDKLRVYKWENDQENPGLLLETENFGGAPRIGDCIGWQGTWESGKLVFANDDGTTTRLITYPITNGRASTTPTVINVTTDGSTRLGTSSSTRPYPQHNGDYWITGHGCPTTYLDSNGKRQYAIDQDVEWGNAFSWFNWNGQRYGVYTTYETPEGDNLNTQTAEQRALNYTKGRFRLFSYDGSWDSTTDIYDYPSWGLSEKRQNINCTSNIVVSVTDNSVEAWLLITNQGISYYVNQGGTPPSYGLEDIISLMPEIRPSATAVNLTGKTGRAATTQFTISGYRLQGDVTFSLTGEDADCFTLSKQVMEKSADVETITVTYNAGEEGSHEALLTCTSPQADDVTIRLTGQTTPPAGVDYNIGNLEERWHYSESKGNLANTDWFSVDPARPTRDIALANWKIYALNSKAWDDSPEVSIVGAYDGIRRATLNMTGISGGESVLASICNLGGMIIGSNGARCAGFQHTETTTDVLKVYRWYNDSSVPELWLEDPTHGDTHVGEIMSVAGDMSYGKVIFSDGSKVLIYKVRSGNITREPIIINLTRDGEPYSVGDIKGAAQVLMQPAGDFWVVGKGCFPTHFDASGAFIEDFADVQFAGDCYGTSAAIFDIGDRKFLAGATYLPAPAQTRVQRAPSGTGVTDGAMAVVDITDGVENAQTNCVYPEDGFGATTNTTFQSRVLYETSTDEERLNLWALIPMQGVAFYKFDAAQNYITGIETLSPDQIGEGDCRYFDLNGMEVNPRNLAPGIYLRRCGDITRKVVVR